MNSSSFTRCDRHRHSARRQPKTDTRTQTSMIVHQWVPAAHRGDAIGDSARRVRDLLRALGHESRHLRADDRRRHARRGRGHSTMPDARRGDLTIFHFARAVADDRGVRGAAARPRAAVPQHHAGAFLRAVRPRDLPDRGRSAAASSRRSRAGRTSRSATPSTTARSSRRSGFGATGVMPIAVDTARLTDGAARIRRSRPSSATA